MIKLCNGAKIYTFEYCYLFVIIIYLAQITPRMGRMISGLTGDWLILFIPIILTVILCLRNEIKVEKILIGVLLLIAFWSISVIINKNLFSLSRLNNYVFLPYAVIVAYVHIKIYDKALFVIYEDIILRICKISLIFWLISLLLPGLNDFWRLFPETSMGNNILYIYNWIDPIKYASAMYRNSGFSWEPGRFACMIIIALSINLLRNGLKIRGNRPFLWFVVTIVSTFSTTGFTIAIVLISIFWLKFNVKTTIFYLLFAVPIVIYIFSLDMMGKKISYNADIKENMHKTEKIIKWYGSQGRTAPVSTLGRFESIYFDATVNIVSEPFLGYGLNYNESEFTKMYKSKMRLCGNFLDVFARFGIFMGLFWYFILYKSSKEISIIFCQNKHWVMFLSFILISISYSVFYYPIWTSMWLYGLFNSKNDYSPIFYFES